MDALYLIAFVALIFGAYFLLGRKRRLRSQVPEHGVWQIGPIINGVSKSVGVPRAMTLHPEGHSFDFPHPNRSAGHVHYVTRRTGPLLGKSRIVMRFRIEADEGVRFQPDTGDENPPSLTVYFQRGGDDWLGGNDRWWAGFATVIPLCPGEHEIVAPLDATWGSVLAGSNSIEDRADFERALRETEQVGFTLGGGSGLGHGVNATGPARFVLLSYEVR